MRVKLLFFASLREQLGTSTHQLAEHADQLILQLYDPSG